MSQAELINTVLAAVPAFGTAIAILILNSIAARARTIDSRLEALEKSVLVLVAQYEAVIQRLNRQDVISDRQIASDNAKK